MAIASVKATINGQQYNLTYNSSTGLYEATIPAPNYSSWPQLNHKYGIILTATDNAGNSTVVDRNNAQFGSELQIRVKETTAPVITPTSPASGANVLVNSLPLEFNVSDNDSGIDWNTLKAYIDGTQITSAITHTTISGGYKCTATLPSTLSDGDHTLKYDVSDNDGNAATTTFSFHVDTVPPSLNVSAPASGDITNQSTIHVMGNASDVTSPPVTVKITVNDVDQGAVTLNASGDFDKAVTLNAASNVIKIVATDKSGRTTTITRNVTLDQSPPVFISVEVAPSMMDAGQTFVVRAQVEDN